VDGRQITRWDKIDDMAKLQADTRAAIQALIDAEKARSATMVKTQGTKLIQPSSPHPPLLPSMPAAASD
jgi:hypothetical protein